MEFLGYLISALNLVAVGTLTVGRKANNLCPEVKRILHYGLTSAYRELLSFGPPQNPYGSSFERSVHRLFSFHLTILEFTRVEQGLKIILPCASVGLVMVIVSFIAGFFLSPNEFDTNRLALQLFFPFIIFVWEAFLLHKCIIYERILNNLKWESDAYPDSYKSLEK